MKKNLFLMSLLVSSALYSQELTLKEVMEKVTSSSHRVKSQENLIEITELNAKQAKRSLLPGLNLQADADLMKIINDEKRAIVGPQTIKAPLVVYSGGRILGNFEKVENRVEMERINLEETTEESLRDAISLYFDILKDEKSIEIHRNALNTLKKQQGRLEVLFNSNKMISKNELLVIQADIKEVESKVLRLQSEISSAKGKLMILTGMDNGNFTVKDLDKSALNLHKISLTEDVKRSFESSTVARKKAIEVENAEIDIKLAKADYYPTVTVTPEYKFDSVDSTGKGFGIGVSAKMNIFQWGATQAAVKAAELNFERKRSEQEETLKGLAVDIATKERELKLISDEIAIAKDRVSLLEENSRIQSVRFSNGMLSSIDYLSSIDRLSKAEEVVYGKEKEYILKNIEYSNLIK